MIIARFSLRWMLIAMAALSVVFLFISLAVKGQHWAIALCAAAATFLVCVLIQAVCFLLARLLAEATQRLRRPKGDASPFSSGPPPQIIPPDNSFVE